ncbi:MAG: hypothetical protein ACD_22C00106G0015 [uncultured bacterium]|nr:MAG: hypothetical protein ACD_22C00106G0015 [uncultured bacterium]
MDKANIIRIISQLIADARMYSGQVDSAVNSYTKGRKLTDLETKELMALGNYLAKLIPQEKEILQKLSLVFSQTQK